MGGSGWAIRTVVVPHRLEPALLRVLRDVRSVVNSLVPDWRAHPEESRFGATKRTYRSLRERYPHLAAGWCVTAANETSALLNAWDRSVRRAKRVDPVRFERMRAGLPRRRVLKASLHQNLFRWDLSARRLDITVRPDLHVSMDLASTQHRLWERYGAASGWVFGLTLRPNALLFHFRVPHPVTVPVGAMGADLNFDSAELATSDGRLTRIDLRPVTEVQRRMTHKRLAIQRRIAKDLRHQRAVLRRYGRREKNRVTPLLHRAANAIVAEAGDRGLVLEDLRDATSTILRQRGRWGSPESRRRLSAWTHGRLVEIIGYKARTPIIWVNPEGTSQECPRCGGQLALPSAGKGHSARPGRMPRQTICGKCGGVWHRDAAAAMVVLSRGCRLLRGATITPSARSALLEAAAWRPTEDGGEGRCSLSGPTVEPMKADTAKFDEPSGFSDR